MIRRARILSAEEAAPAEPLPTEEVPTRPRARVIPKAVVDASREAAELLARAEARAAETLRAVERQVADLKLRAETEARAEATAKLASQALALASHEARADERSLDRTVALARLLAERLLGESLRVAPEQVTALARQALAEARGARRITLVAHPEDARLLEAQLPSMGLVAETLRLLPDGTRARGSLRIETEIGVLDADLAPQLDRLARRLRESLSGQG